MQQLIYISSKGQQAENIANILTNILNKLYQGSAMGADANVLAMASSPSNTGINIIKNATCAICIRTPENTTASASNSYHYLEAGALEASVLNKDGAYINYMFCNSETPLTISKKTHTHLYMPTDASKEPVNNKQNFISMIEKVDEHLNPDYQLGKVEIHRRLDTMWLSFIQDDFYHIANILTSPTQNIGKQQDNTKYPNKYDISKLQDSLISGLTDSFVGNTPAEISKHFHGMLLNMPGAWVVQGENDLKFGVHRVVVGNTRFSNFVVFSDGKRIVLFDRYANVHHTHVNTDRYDVFGSVQFENKTLFNKIKSTQFADKAAIRAYENIPGLAIEHNLASDKSFEETAVMIGLYIEVSSDDLDLAMIGAKDNEIIILDVPNMSTEFRYNLTAKAELGVKYIESKIANLS